jgi:alanine racemase
VLPEQVPSFAEYDLILTGSSMELLDVAEEVSRVTGKRIKTHLKIDTGMARFGFTCDQLADILAHLSQTPAIKIVGVFTHFAQAASADHSYTYEQTVRFEKAQEIMRAYGIYPQHIHAENSAAALTARNPNNTMARIGLGIYGWWPTKIVQDETIAKYPEFSLKPVISLSTRVITIRSIDAHEYVGYDRTYKTTRSSRFAILPIGYFDGYDRRLSNRSGVMIRGQYAPIRGTIAMNNCTVDITHIHGVQVDDQVLLLGDMPHMGADDLATVVGSFNPRELLARLPTHLPRMIVHQPSLRMNAHPTTVQSAAQCQHCAQTGRSRQFCWRVSAWSFREVSN